MLPVLIIGVLHLILAASAQGATAARPNARPASSGAPTFRALAAQPARPAAAAAQPVTQCGRRKTARIVGGTPTIINEFPMMAGLIKGRTAAIHCGATIVSNWYAATAAHCTSGLQPSDLQLLVGEHDYASASETPYAKLYAVQGIVTHPQYSSSADLNDIALVRTGQSIVYNVAVGPVCLPNGNDQYLGQVVEAVGWGTDSFGGRVSTVLKKVSLSVISNAQCAQSYGNRIQNSHMCSWTRGRDACQHDSGGPLFITSGGFVYLAGIVSWGTTCADNYPSVATRVTYFADWLRQYAR